MSVLKIKDAHGNWVGILSISGSDAEVTAENIRAALGFDAADHSSRHAAGGADALTPADISAAAELHKARHATGGADALTPADIAAIPYTEKSAANGVASLDGSSKVDAAQANSRIVSNTASLTLGLTHAGTFILMDSTSDMTVTVPANASAAFPVGTEVEICRWNTGTVTIASATGVTITSIDDQKVISDRYGCVSLKKISTDTWLLAGALT